MTEHTVPYQAVILAAGRGSRFGARTEEIPKALLPIGPRSRSDATETSFLRRQCELLREAGVAQIVVVVGYLRDAVEEAVRTWGLDLQLVVNPTPEISTSGSLHSFQFAARAGLGVLDGAHQTLLIDADIVYDRRMLAQFFAAPAQTSVLVCTAFHPGDEEVLVWGTAEQPRFMAKGLDEQLTGGAQCLGEATGIVKFAPADHALARRTIDWMLGDPDAPPGSAARRGFAPARQATEHEELTQRFMHYGRMRCVTFGDEYPFMEVDSEKEYALLREALYPRLLDLESDDT